MTSHRNDSACFVIGTGRCGSTLLSRLLGLHPALLSLSEFFTVLGGPKAFAQAHLDSAALERLLFQLHHDVIEHLAGGSIPEAAPFPSQADRAEQGPLMLVPLPHLTRDPASLHAALREAVRTFPSAPTATQIERVFEFLMHRLGRQRWVERSGGSIEFEEQLRAHWPHAKFIYLLRDGPECAYSMSRHLFFRVRVARLVSGIPDLPVKSCLEQTLPLDRFGAYWSALALRMRRAIKSLPPERVRVLRYERLCRDPVQELGSIWSFLDLDPPDVDVCNDIRARVHAPRSGLHDLSEAQRAPLHRACRPGTRALAQLP